MMTGREGKAHVEKVQRLCDMSRRSEQTQNIDSRRMTDFAAGDAVYFIVWSDCNRGPSLAWEYSGTVIDGDSGRGGAT